MNLNYNDEEDVLAVVWKGFSFFEDIPNESIPLRKRLNGGTVPPFKMHHGGTVPPSKMHHGGTVPPYKMHRGGTVPPFKMHHGGTMTFEKNKLN